MKQKKASVILTISLAILLVAFVTLGHIVGGLAVLTGVPAGPVGFVLAILNSLSVIFSPDFANLTNLITFIVVAVLVVTALVLTLVWAIRLLVFRHRACNLFSPLLFLLSFLVGVVLVLATDVAEVAFSQTPSQVAVAYFYIYGVAVFSVGLHLLVVGLANSGKRKVESLLPVDLDVYAEIDEVVLEKPVKEPVAEPVEEPVLEVVEETVVEPEPKVVEQAPVKEAAPVVAEEPKVIIKEVHVVEQKVAELDLTDAKLHALIRKLANDEIDKRPVPEKVVVHEVERVVVEPKPVAKPAVVKEEPKPVVKPVVVKVEPKPAVVVPPPAAAKKEVLVERIPFPERMQIVDPEVKADYNLLKNYLLSFGLNSRISNVADSFRLGRNLFAKLTNSGNSGLKLYLPINPDDYKDSKIPLKSAEGIKQYEDVPTFIYVRSELSMKRAHQLIDDIMLKNGITRKFEATNTDHIAELLK